MFVTLTHLNQHLVKMQPQTTTEPLTGTTVGLTSSIFISWDTDSDYNHFELGLAPQ